MQIEQRLRQKLNRLKRRLLGEGADQTASFVMEDAAPRPAAPRPTLGMALGRGFRFGAGFLTTALVCAVAFLTLSAFASRVEPAPSTMLALAPAGHAAAAAIDAHLAASERNDLADAAFFWRSARMRRSLAFEAGVQDAFIAWSEVEADFARRGDQAPAEFRAALAGEAAPPDRRAARAALARRLEAAARAGSAAPIDPASYQSLAQRAQAAAIAHVALLAAAVRTGHFGPLTGAEEAAFFRARGAAFGWRLVLAAAANDLAPDVRARATLEIASALLFVLNGPADAWATPNHFAPLALELSEAAASLETLAGAVEPSRPRRR
jgi:hypothetical protein